MEFSERLNSYLVTLDVSGKELSEECRVSQVVICRYRSGQRIPSPENTGVLIELAIGIESLSRKMNTDVIKASDVIEAFTTDLSDRDVPFCADNFNLLVEKFSLNASEMSRSMSYDPSYISRIRSGKRRPPHPEEFITKLSQYILPRLGKSIPSDSFLELLGIDEPEEITAESLKELLRAFLIRRVHPDSKAVESFLRHVDDFNLNDFIKEIHYDDIRVPSVPFTFPKDKTYYGIEGQKEAEIDIFKLIVLSKSKEPVVLYSDMDMEELARDQEFQKKWLFGLALMLKKGLHLKYIHNLNRPMNEMMLGLENLIPLYMTGQIEPYYLPDRQNDVFRHIYRISGTAAMTGSGISGNSEGNVYQVSTSKNVVAGIRLQTDEILTHALPLMEIYNEDHLGEFVENLKAFKNDHSDMYQILSGLPVYTIPSDTLDDMLSRYNADIRQKEEAKTIFSIIRENIESKLEKNTICVEMPILSESTFKENPPALQIPGSPLTGKIIYTYEEYSRPLKATEEFASANTGYTLIKKSSTPFSNINILISKGNYVCISKMLSPTIQFIIRHPELRDAIEKGYIPSPT